MYKAQRKERISWIQGSEGRPGAGTLRGGAVISTEVVATGGLSHWITLDLL